MTHLTLLCLSDLHFGEGYTFMNYGTGWDWNNLDPLNPFYWGVASLAGLNASDPPDVHAETLVLLGDIFELATATIGNAAESGRHFFNWLFQWLHPKQVIYIPGNHDHVFWMWWTVPPPTTGSPWWLRNPSVAGRALREAYAGLGVYASDPVNPEGMAQKPWRPHLIAYFFGSLVNPNNFYVAYPAFMGPPCHPPGAGAGPYKTLFTHGHLNDSTFVDPGNSGFLGWAMYAASGTWPRPAEMTDLAAVEKSTWKYTTFYWYPPLTETTFGEALYLGYVQFEEGYPCIHPGVHQGTYIQEAAPDLEPGKSNQRYLSGLSDSLNRTIGAADPHIYIYGHTHNGGALPLDTVPHIYNTGGWLEIVTDNPPHTHLFAITPDGIARMIRVHFA
jgi:hypothetical protein